MAAQESDRDFRSELESGLVSLFGDTLVSYDLHQDMDQTMFILGAQGSAAQINNLRQYKISVQVKFNVSDRLKGLRITRDSIVLGNYGPFSMSETQELGLGKIVVRVEYVTSDLEDFLKTLKEKSWNNFNKEFTEQLDTKLGTSDT